MTENEFEMYPKGAIKLEAWRTYRHVLRLSKNTYSIAHNKMSRGKTFHSVCLFTLWLFVDFM